MNASHPWRIWLVALGTAWVFDLLFWGKAPGVSVPLWVLLVLAGTAWLAFSENKKPARAGYLLAGLAVLLSVISFWRVEPFTRFMNISMALGSLLLLAATFRSGYWPFYRITDYLLSGLRLLGGMLSRPLKLQQQLIAAGKGDHGAVSPIKALWRQALPVLRGLLLALPVVVVLGLLLASADPIFEDRIGNLLSFLEWERIPELLFRTFYVIVILTHLLSGAYLYALLPAGDERHPTERAGWLQPMLGWVESVVVLLSVNLLFIAFVVIQFQYLFGGEANINAAGYTYSEYARRGFGELVAVAIISLLLYFALGAITRQDTWRKRTVFSIVASLLMALVMVMLVSAYLRLSLYEQAYGFTRLRAYTHAFIIWMGLVLGAMVVIEAFSRRERQAIVLLAACVGFTLSLAGMNVDGFIASQNIRRALDGQELDVSYLADLSPDAVPVMLETFQSGVLDEDDHIALGRELTCRLADTFPQEEARSWPSFHLGEYQSMNLLLQQRDALKDYRLIQNRFGNYEAAYQDGAPQSCYHLMWSDW